MDRIAQAPTLQHIDVSGPAAQAGDVRRMAWWFWPSREPARSVVVCVHGLTRQGRDFDVLAGALSHQAHVVAVDVAGRGHSDWLADPMGYQVPTYAADLGQLLHHLRQRFPGLPVDWVGTSMGGLIGMTLAAQPALAPRRLVLNDVGPVIEWEALRRIADYLGRSPTFSSEAEGVRYLVQIAAGFGLHSDAEWHALSAPMLRLREGIWGLHYDPTIAVPVQALMALDETSSRQAVLAGEAALWALYDRIEAPTLLLRGADSDLLTRETADAMSRRGPKARCVEFACVGHAPSLVPADQVAAVCAFLDAA
ncbi:alpha/beta fold hydrolase [Hydrogenophaga electricum]|uniref:Alpha/beta hydrolase n=1 Tax=Hydrogenophaga electricum TaxID=1230953 RepID=A0ABQ6BZ26_9BURK|nr:alpha/beta fold hydrolase [Hydrogenophaga electricum]GLS12875.1 alpha/beta hydrolase [Hydrogenophaga electricum]